MYLIFDTETTGLPRNWNAPITDTDNWPRCIQIAWQLHDEMGKVIEHQDYLVKPDGFNIPFDAERIHGISTELAEEQGISLQEVLEKFNIALSKAKFVVGQNVGFDLNVMGCEFHRMEIPTDLNEKPVLDTCTEITAELLKLPGGRGGRYKLPTLTELHQYLFGIPFSEAHNATADVEATTRCFLELIRKEVFTKEELDVPADYFKNFKENNPNTIQLIGLKHINLKSTSDKIRERISQEKQHKTETTDISAVTGDFVHLHNHTQFSVLQSTISVQDLVSATAKQKMKAVAITDTGNMMGAFQFVSKIENHNKSVKAKNAEIQENGGIPTETTIKPIVGCQLFVCDNHTDKSRKDNGYQIIFLAKNKKGYHNLAKMSSIAYTKGFYYVPRIDKGIIEQYKEDIMVLSGNLYGEIPSKILNIGESQAEEALIWWKEQFGEDFYLELMRHNQQDEDVVNKTLIEFSKKHNVKLVATNNTYYVNKEDANAHDILLCVKDGEKQETPKGRGRGFRYGLDNEEYYFKSSDQMKVLFSDIPEAINNIDEIVEKVEPYSLYRDVLLPKFDIPSEFLVEEDEKDEGKRGENNYLRHLTYVGAEKRYKEITEDIRERLDFELATIEKTGYPGYFLIVQDFIAAAREMGVSVGPGRGSAAGSAVAYCLGITNIDPIEYDLLFERFLNPDRVSMPDIDIDFDDEGRGKVMQYVIDKYGKNQVAQIITYGTMAAKSSIRDTARVLDLPLFEADRIAKLIPNMSLAKIFSLEESALKSALRSDEYEKVAELKKIATSDDLTGQTIQQAKMLEGSLRNTGIHACGVIITPDDISNFVPIASAKDESGLNVTQFDNSVAESAGLLKMDFLGLKTLTLIKDTVKLVKYTKNIDLDPDHFPIDDKKTYELFQRGETVGIFQYESPGMQKYMKDLKPTVFGDLIAMNALYRPGPIEYIPSFVRRKNGEEEIKYDLDAMEEYLSETYGITVYQEQVMLLSQKLADFSKGDADVLRKAMGKKQKDVLDKMKPRFIEQASAKGHNPEILEKVWKDWEAFASYAFNKSHSTCYAWIAYQTAYLKAHFPSEYMAAVLSNNMNDIKSVTFFMEECKRMGIEVLPPDVNESYYKFTVNENNAIRFGMGAVKNVGMGAVQTIVDTRKDGNYKSVFDLARRIDLRSANKKAFENLALAGGFDCFKDTHRAQYFSTDGDGVSFLEKVIRYGAKHQENENSAQVSLFGDSSEVQIAEPVVPSAEEWGAMEKLAREKEVVGIYISGHPLDGYKYELKYFCNTKLSHLNDLKNYVGKQITVGGIITKIEHRVSQKDNKGWAMFTVEGYDNSYDFRIFEGKDATYSKYRPFLVQNNFVHIRLTVQEGWTNRETGQAGEPRIQFLNIQYLQDILPTFAKSLVIRFNLKDMENKVVETILEAFRRNRGNHSVSFEVYELDENQQTKQAVSTITLKPQSEDSDMDEIEDFTDSEEIIEIDETELITETEEVKVLNHLAMDSRNMKINICKELLDELEQNQINFRLN